MVVPLLVPLSPWIVRINRAPEEARLRIFCFPFAGRGASVFAALRSHVPADIDLCVVQLPGRETRIRETPPTNAGAVARLLPSILAPYLDRPFALLGHSLGALLAFETARALAAGGGPRPVHLFVGAHRAPRLPRHAGSLHRLPDDEFIAELQARYGGIPEVVLAHRELLRISITLLRADLTMVETYEYAEAPLLDCPITALGGTGDRTVPVSHLTPWRLETRAAFRCRLVEGDHFFLKSAPAAVAAAIADAFAMR